MKKFYFFLVALTLSVATMGLSSCGDDEPWEYNYFDAELIPGDPWIQPGYEIRYLGDDEYEVYNTKTQLYHTEFLEPFGSYESSVPEEIWPEKFKPYFNLTYHELCWYVYSRGSSSEFIILKNGKIIRK